MWKTENMQMYNQAKVKGPGIYLCLQLADTWAIKLCTKITNVCINFHVNTLHTRNVHTVYKVGTEYTQ